MARIKPQNWKHTLSNSQQLGGIETSVLDNGAASVCSISLVTEVYVTVKGCLFVVKEPKPIAAQEKVNVKQLPARRKQLKNK